MAGRKARICVEYVSESVDGSAVLPTQLRIPSHPWVKSLRVAPAALVLVSVLASVLVLVSVFVFVFVFVFAFAFAFVFVLVLVLVFVLESCSGGRGMPDSPAGWLPLPQGIRYHASSRGAVVQAVDLVILAAGLHSSKLPPLSLPGSSSSAAAVHGAHRERGCKGTLSDIGGDGLRFLLLSQRMQERGHLVTWGVSHGVCSVISYRNAHQAA